MAGAGAKSPKKVTQRGRYDRNQSREERFEEQRVRFLDSATEVFATKGFVDTTVQDITEKSGLSRATFYTHFKDIDDLRFHVFERASGRATAIIVTSAAGAAPRDRLREGIRAYFHLLTTWPNVARVIFHEVRMPLPRNMRRREKIMSRFIEVFRSGLEEAHKNGTISKVPDEVTIFAVIAAIEGVALRYLDKGEEAKADEAIPSLLAFIQRAFA
ncbi:MAG: TetR/AcrR family transcriptional regulator [Polyangiaceae bacterium]